MTFYARRGSKYECYFGIAPWARIGLGRYLFEKFVMFNPVVMGATRLKARAFDLRTNGKCQADADELRSIEALFEVKS